jgi:hypothetical protein
MSVQLPTCVIHIELRQWHAVRTRDRDEYVIDLGRNLREEPQTNPPAPSPFWSRPGVTQWTRSSLLLL